MAPPSTTICVRARWRRRRQIFTHTRALFTHSAACEDDRIGLVIARAFSHPPPESLNFHFPALDRFNRIEESPLLLFCFLPSGISPFHFPALDPSNKEKSPLLLCPLPSGISPPLRFWPTPTRPPLPLLFVFGRSHRLGLPMVVCVQSVWNACLRTSRWMDVVSVTRRSSGVAPRACARVCRCRKIFTYIHTYAPRSTTTCVYARADSRQQITFTYIHAQFTETKKQSPKTLAAHAQAILYTIN